MANKLTSNKYMLIDKANSSMVLAVSIAAAVTIFCLVASRGLIIQRNYQAKVISKKQTALKTLQKNNKAVEELAGSYQEFVGRSENVIKGSSSGTGNRDGDNAKVTLDALPSKYDFPAVGTSLEKILSDGNFKINSIQGSDDEANQQLPANGSPQPIAMPFIINFDGNTDTIPGLIATLQQSIRPISVGKITLKALSNNGLTADITAKTFYQPARTLDIKKEVVK